MTAINSLRESLKFALDMFQVEYSNKYNTKRLLRIFKNNIDCNLFLKEVSEASARLKISPFSCRNEDKLGYNLPKIFYYKINTFDYFQLDLILDRDFMVFKNSLLQRPGVDFIIDRTTQSYHEGSKIIFRKNLVEGDVISFLSNQEVYWYVFEGQELVDKSYDKNGYLDEEWLN